MDLQKELIAEFERELTSTRKMLEAIPADADFGFQPNPKSMTLGRLAGHVAELVGQWANSILTQEKMAASGEHYTPASKAALLDRFAQETALALSSLKSFTLADWDGRWKFLIGARTVIDDAKYSVWRAWVVNHSVHHRAQLGVYLRLLGAPIPGMYGPSADDQRN